MNGSFTQIDMRDISKPLDAIPRTSTTWTPQGALAFITDNVPSWEIPYDDMYVAILIMVPGHTLLTTALPNRQPVRLNSESAALAKPQATKRIGDRPFRPKTQKFGTFSLIQDHLEADAFGKLACSYVIDGNDWPALCAINTQVSAFSKQAKEIQRQICLATGRHCRGETPCRSNLDVDEIVINELHSEPPTNTTPIPTYTCSFLPHQHPPSYDHPNLRSGVLYIPTERQFK